MINSWMSYLGAVFFSILAFGLSAHDGKPAKPPASDTKPPQADKVPAKPQIATPIPGYQDYDEIGEQLNQWVQQAPGLAKTGTYGKTTNDLPLRYIRVTNLFDPKPKKKVLIHSCIHGNEPWACSTTMAMIGTMLSEYGTKKETTELINTRDIYFIPVVSPDSYPSERHVDGVDPNRDFPHPEDPDHESVPPIEALQKFFLKHKFDAALSGHTFGRFYWSPYADTTEPCAHKKDYDRVLGAMQAMNKYGRWLLGEDDEPERGTEVDWYYRNGAFAIGCEFGTHQQIPTMEETKTEFDKTYKPFLYFLKEGPLVVVRPKNKTAKPKK